MAVDDDAREYDEDASVDDGRAREDATATVTDERERQREDDEDAKRRARKPRLAIKKMVLENFKSYAGAQHVGPFHKVRVRSRASAPMSTRARWI
jgi:hypothetical protein